MTMFPVFLVVRLSFVGVALIHPRYMPKGGGLEVYHG